jgi:hypothetical protein
MDSGECGLGLDPEFMQVLAQQQAAVTRLVMVLAGCEQRQAEEALLQSNMYEEKLGDFFELFFDEKKERSHPIMGVRFHWPDGKTSTTLIAPVRLARPSGLVTPKGGQVSVSGSLNGDFGTDLGAYLAVLSACTSLVGRAVLLAQGYRLEFLRAATPDKPKGAQIKPIR